MSPIMKLSQLTYEKCQVIAMTKLPKKCHDIQLRSKYQIVKLKIYSQQKNSYSNYPSTKPANYTDDRITKEVITTTYVSNY